MAQKVLIAVDGSDRCMAVVQYAANWLHPGDAEITLYAVINSSVKNVWDIVRPGGAGDGSEAWAEEQKDSMKYYMEHAKERFAKTGHDPASIKTKIKVKKTGVARHIIDEANSGYQTIIIGRRGHSGIKELMLGGTSMKLISQLNSQNLWVVGQRASSDKVLIALDGSENGERCLQYYVDAHPNRRPKVVLLHVLPELPNALEDRREEMERDADEYLRTAGGRLAAMGVDAERIETRTITVADGKAYGLVRAAQRLECGTIILGRRGAGDAAGFASGRVANKVLHMAKGLAVWVVN